MLNTYYDRDGYEHYLVSKETGEMCVQTDRSSALWAYRQAPEKFWVVREHKDSHGKTEWLHAVDGNGVWKNAPQAVA